MEKIIYYDRVSESFYKTMIEEGRRYFDDLIEIFNRIVDKSQKAILVAITSGAYIFVEAIKDPHYMIPGCFIVASLLLSYKVMYGISSSVKGMYPKDYINEEHQTWNDDLSAMQLGNYFNVCESYNLKIDNQRSVNKEVTLYFRRQMVALYSSAFFLAIVFTGVSLVLPKPILVVGILYCGWRTWRGRFGWD